MVPPSWHKGNQGIKACNMRRLIGEAAEKVEMARERDMASLAKDREADVRLSRAAAAEERVQADAAAVKAAANAAEQDAKNAKRVIITKSRQHAPCLDSCGFAMQENFSDVCRGLF